MIQFLSGTTIVLSTLWPSPTSLSDNRFIIQEPLVLKEYVSPTVNYNPMKEYEEKSIQKIMDKILIESILE